MSIYSILFMVIINLDISNSKFKTIVHAVAMNENRYQFSRRSIYTGETDAKNKNDVAQSDGKYRLEKDFLGAHSDIGGGYHEGDLSDVALVWMANEANKLYRKEKIGTNIDLTVKDKKRDKNEHRKISNPIVHDSIGVERAAGTIIFSPSRQFRWSTEGGGIEQFGNIPHLRFGWRRSQLYQPEGATRFDDIRRLSDKYMRRWTCGYIINDCPEVDRIRAFKGIDGEGQPSILYGKGAVGNNQRYILIQDYINWLTKNGYDLDGLSIDIK